MSHFSPKMHSRIRFKPAGTFHTVSDLSRVAEGIVGVSSGSSKYPVTWLQIAVCVPEGAAAMCGEPDQPFPRRPRSVLT